MGRPFRIPVCFFVKRQSLFLIFQNTIGHLAPRVAADRNLAPFDTAAILARSFSVQFTGAAGGLKRCTPIYSPSAAFGSVPTATDIYVTHSVPVRIANNAQNTFKVTPSMLWMARIFFEIPFLSCRVFSVSNLLVAYIEFSGLNQSYVVNTEIRFDVLFSSAWRYTLCVTVFP